MDKEIEFGWGAAVHLSACEAAGKTLLLRLVGEDLLDEGKEVYFFENSKLLGAVYDELRDLDKRLLLSNERAYLLVDETQVDAGSPAFTFLLKNAKNIVTIGVGVPKYESSSEYFATRLDTKELFLDDDDLETEGVLQYFVGDTTTEVGTEITTMLKYLCQHAGGHIYPVMRLGELLVPMVKTGVSAADAIIHFESLDFRASNDYTRLYNRIAPNVKNQDVLQLLRSEGRDEEAVENLARAGFCTDGGQILSDLLLEAHLTGITSKWPGVINLKEGLEGVQQLLSYAVPYLDLRPYDEHGGPVEDAITFQVLSRLAGVRQLDTRLFNPKLVDAGTSARRPDMFLNSTCNSYVECVYIKSASQITGLDQHIAEFYEPKPLTKAQQQKKKKNAKNGRPTKERGELPHYVIAAHRTFAILSFQSYGREPLKPSPKWKDVFEERVFTYAMPTKRLYRGTTEVSV
jgi:hypothetical protein